MGIPFLHPWANRLRRFGYRFDGREVELHPSSPLLRLDGNGLPIHGLLTASRQWALQALVADADRASMTATLDFDSQELLAAFPFKHKVEITVVMDEHGVEITTILNATGEEPVPIAFGFHPYLQIPGVPRAQWDVSFPVRRRLILDGRGIPTGASEPVEHLRGAVGERTWDDGFDRIDHPARFEITAGRRTIAIEYSHGYPVAQVFAPPGEQYLCVEPMTAPTDALNGAAGPLRCAAPDESFSASFRISTTFK